MKRKFTIQDAIIEIKRELKIRKRVYPNLISNKKLNRERAYSQYWALEKALHILEAKQSEKLGVQKKLSL